jgi:hypothetical protein
MVLRNNRLLTPGRLMRRGQKSNSTLAAKVLGVPSQAVLAPGLPMMLPFATEEE